MGGRLGRKTLILGVLVLGGFLVIFSRFWRVSDANSGFFIEFQEDWQDLPLRDPYIEENARLITINGRV